MRRRRRRIKVASKWPKIEYVVAWGIGIHDLGTFLCLSKLLWVCESSEVWPTKKTPNSKSLLKMLHNLNRYEIAENIVFSVCAYIFCQKNFVNKSGMGLQSL